MVGHNDFEFAYDKQTLGVDLKSRVRDMEDLKITAFHEAGHTLVAIYTKDTTPIHKVTIVAKVLVFCNDFRLIKMKWASNDQITESQSQNDAFLR